MTNDKSSVWIEEFRPSVLSELRGRDAIVKRLNKCLDEKSISHLLFAGMRGTGKTAAATIVGRELFGNTFGDNFTELNASDERGINVVRNTISNIAGTQPEGDHDFRIIFLDEADALTSDAQNSLKRTMEKNTDNCRFILSCNHSSKLIPEIQSRCAIYRFGRLNNKAITETINYIIQHKKLQISSEGIKALLYAADGDMRKAINILQSASLAGEKIVGKTIYEIVGYAQPKFIEEMIDLAFKGKFLESKNKLDILLIDEGFSGGDIVYQVHRTLLNMGLPNDLMLAAVYIMGEVDFRISEGSNDKIQLDYLLSCLAKVGSAYK